MKAKDLKQGDVFIFREQEHVAIENFGIGQGCLWVTQEKFYLNEEARKEYVYGYTNSTMIALTGEEDVVFVKNIENKQEKLTPPQLSM